MQINNVINLGTAVPIVSVNGNIVPNDLKDVYDKLRMIDIMLSIPSWLKSGTIYALIKPKLVVFRVQLLYVVYMAKNMRVFELFVLE